MFSTKKPIFSVVLLTIVCCIVSLSSVTVSTGNHLDTRSERSATLTPRAIKAPKMTKKEGKGEQKNINVVDTPVATSAPTVTFVPTVISAPTKPFEPTWFPTA